MVTVEGFVHDRSSNLQHQMCALRRPAHLLLSIHPAMQQPLNCAFRGCRRDRFLASPGRRVVDDDIGLSGYVCLQSAQKVPNLPRGPQSGSTGGLEHRQRFTYEIKASPDLAMPETPADPLDGFGKADARLAILRRSVWPPFGRLGNMLDPH